MGNKGLGSNGEEEGIEIKGGKTGKERQRNRGKGARGRYSGQ